MLELADLVGVDFLDRHDERRESAKERKVDFVKTKRGGVTVRSITSIVLSLSAFCLPIFCYPSQLAWRQMARSDPTGSWTIWFELPLAMSRLLRNLEKLPSKYFARGLWQVCSAREHADSVPSPLLRFHIRHRRSPSLLPTDRICPGLL